MSKKHQVRIKNSLLKLKVALSQETKETHEMLVIYKKFSRNQATPEEMDKANAQFQDLLKTLGLGVFSILPFAPITIPLIIKLGRKFGIDVLPSSFKKEKD